jgi:hypothetical protein
MLPKSDRRFLSDVILRMPRGRIRDRVHEKPREGERDQTIEGDAAALRKLGGLHRGPRRRARVIRLALADADVCELPPFGGGSRIAGVRAAVAAVLGIELLALVANAIGGCLLDVASQKKTVIEDIRGGISNSFRNK